jgi:hypothetical protein
MVFPRRTIYLCVKGQREIPLTRVGQPMTLEEIETQAAELAQFYKRFIIKLKLCIKLIRFCNKSKSNSTPYRTYWNHPRSIIRTLNRFLPNISELEYFSNSRVCFSLSSVSFNAYFI